MSESAEIKNALANFLGFAMSKSKELDSAIMPGSAVSKNNTNIDYLITKVANDVESKFGPGQQYQPPPPVNDIAAQLIPMPADMIPSPAPVAPPVQEQRHEADQLEFNFTEPNNQTQIILGEIKQLNSKLNKIINLLEGKSTSKANKK